MTTLVVFGFVIVEVSAAHPFDRGSAIQWQVGIRQGF
jgi:hypothetical protein